MFTVEDGTLQQQGLSRGDSDVAQFNGVRLAGVCAAGHDEVIALVGIEAELDRFCAEGNGDIAIGNFKITVDLTDGVTVFPVIIGHGNAIVDLAAVFHICAALDTETGVEFLTLFVPAALNGAAVDQFAAEDIDEAEVSDLAVVDQRAVHIECAGYGESCSLGNGQSFSGRDRGLSQCKIIAKDRAEAGLAVHHILKLLRCIHGAATCRKGKLCSGKSRDKLWV